MKQRWKKTLGIALIVLLLGAVVGLRLRRRPVLLAVGRFHPVAHRGSGLATLIQMPGGRRVLRLNNVRTGAGNSLQVCLVAATDCQENECVERAGFIVLGIWRNGAAEQVFNLPDTTDPEPYRAVTIWHPKYRVNFTTAPLSPP
jgi:hypothetical protein